MVTCIPVLSATFPNPLKRKRSYAGFRNPPKVWPHIVLCWYRCHYKSSQLHGIGFRERLLDETAEKLHLVCAIWAVVDNEGGRRLFQAKFTRTPCASLWFLQRVTTAHQTSPSLHSPASYSLSPTSLISSTVSLGSTPLLSKPALFSIPQLCQTLSHPNRAAIIHLPSRSYLLH